VKTLLGEFLNEFTASMLFYSLAHFDERVDRRSGRERIQGMGWDSS
jgi:hypothetical protein